MPAGEHAAPPARAGASRVVVLTAGEDYGLGVVRRLALRGVPCTVALESHAALPHCFRATGWRRLVEAPVALARGVRRWLRVQGRRRAIARWNTRVVVTGPRNSPRMVADLARLAPDVLVLAGIGIVDTRVLALPRLGTVNGHPALLPWVRGNGVVAHSLARGVAIGATVHRVDAGIDTGAILGRRLLPVPRDAGLPALSVAAVALAADLLADVVEGAVADGTLPAGTPQAGRFPLRRWMEPDRWRSVEAAVAGGLAERLFAQWAPLCRPPGPPWALPPDVAPPDGTPALDTGAAAGP